MNPLYHVIGIVGACIFTYGIIGMYSDYNSDHIKQQVKSGTFHMKYGGDVCGEFHQTPCGITLKKCASEMEYYCLHDVNAKFDKVKSSK